MEKHILNTDAGQLQFWFASQGPKLAIFHHGVPKPRELTVPELAAFAKHGYSVAVPVRPGYLESSPAATTPTMADIAGLTQSLLEHLGFEHYLSVGFRAAVRAHWLMQPPSRSPMRPC